jgi:hypothetical protein
MEENETLSYGTAEELGHGRSLAPPGGDSSDERISGAFYIGRASFRMETIEGGVVSAPLLGAHTPARGVGYLPVDEDLASGEEIPGEDLAGADLPASTTRDGFDSRSWDDQPTTVYVETFSPRAPLLMSRSLAVTIGLLAFLSGALVSAIGFTTLKHPPALIARAAALVPLERVKTVSPPVAPAPPSLPATAPDLPEPPSLPPAELLSVPELAAPESAGPPVPTAAGEAVAESPATVTPRALHRRAKRPPRGTPSSPAAEGSWVDPFADWSGSTK